MDIIENKPHCCGEPIIGTRKRMDQGKLQQAEGDTSTRKETEHKYLSHES